MVNDALTVAKFYNLQGNLPFKQSVMRVGSNSNSTIVDDHDTVLTKPLVAKLSAKPVFKKRGFSAQGFWTGSALLGIMTGISSHFMPFSDDLSSGSVVFQPLEEYRILTRNSTFVHDKNSPNSSKTLHLTVQNKKSLSEYQLEATVSRNQAGQSVVSALTVLSSQETYHFPDLPNNKLLVDANQQVTLTLSLDSSKDIKATGKALTSELRSCFKTLPIVPTGEKESTDTYWKLQILKAPAENSNQFFLLPPSSLEFLDKFKCNLTDDLKLVPILERTTVMDGLSVQNYRILEKCLTDYGTELISLYLQEQQIDLNTIVERLEHLHLPSAESMVTHKIKMDKSTVAILTVATIAAGIGGLLGGWGPAWLERWKYRNHHHPTEKNSVVAKPIQTLKQTTIE
jgi:hypothetical protein